MICSNNPSEVNSLLKLLKVEDYADVPYELKVKEAVAGLKAGAKPKYEVPSYIPRLGTLRSTLARFSDIRGAPKKVILNSRFESVFVQHLSPQALIRIMAECASDENEKRRLLELCSLQGSEDYVQLIREHEINVIDLLTTFPSVALPVERLLEQLPRLLPRPYSISSSPLKVSSNSKSRKSSYFDVSFVKDPNVAKFVFNIVDFPMANGRTYPRKGLATGRFHEMLHKMRGVAADGPKQHVTISFCGFLKRGFSKRVDRFFFLSNDHTAIGLPAHERRVHDAERRRDGPDPRRPRHRRRPVRRVRRSSRGARKAAPRRPIRTGMALLRLPA